MNNKIQPLGQAPVARTTRADKAQASEQGGSHKAGATPSATVNLSETTLKLHEMEQKLADVPVVDSSRVEAIRLALANNAYNIDPQRIADGLLAMDNNLPVRED